MFGLSTIRAINAHHANKINGIQPPPVPELTEVEASAIRGAKQKRLRRSLNNAAE